MSKGLFITGTGTDVGKTFVTALIVKKLHESGFDTAYFKAAVSGNSRDGSGRLIPGDALYVKNVSGIPQPLDEMCPYVYEQAVSPHLASKLEGGAVEFETVRERFEALDGKHEYITMEGSGGIVCPIRYDDKKILLEDIITGLSLSTLIVADAGLGTINSVVLTCEYMRNRDIPVKGIIFNHFHKGDIMEEDNVKMCRELTGIEVAACVSDNDTEIDIDAGFLASLYGGLK